MEANTITAGKKITFNGQDITIKELTVAQIRKIILSFENGEESHVIEEVLGAHLPAIAIAEATGLTIEEMEQVSPSVLNELVKEVEKTNPFFVEMIEKRLEIMENLKQGLSRVSGLSKETSATS